MEDFLLDALQEIIHHARDINIVHNANNRKIIRLQRQPVSQQAFLTF